MNGEAIFKWVLAGPDKAECVRVLPDEWLRRLSGFLSLDYDENGVTGELLGMCMVEIFWRFLKQPEPQGQVVPATEEGAV